MDVRLAAEEGGDMSVAKVEYKRAEGGCKDDHSRGFGFGSGKLWIW